VVVSCGKNIAYAIVAANGLRAFISSVSFTRIHCAKAKTVRVKFCILC
jgi:hypothetical protein